MLEDLIGPLCNIGILGNTGGGGGFCTGTF